MIDIHTDRQTDSRHIHIKIDSNIYIYICKEGVSFGRERETDRQTDRQISEI